jgi:hypothetical protein
MLENNRDLRHIITNYSKRTIYNELILILKYHARKGLTYRKVGAQSYRSNVMVT